MSPLQNNVILVPTDFSDTCGNAIEHAVRIANDSHFKITLLHIINKETLSQLKKEHLGLEAVLAKLQAIKDDILKKNDLEVDFIAREGSIFETVQEVATDIKARLMVLGTHGKKGLQHLFGSHAFKVITQSPCTVLVVQKETNMQHINKIAFPINYFTEPRQQVESAVNASKLFGSEILVLKQVFTDSERESSMEIITDQIVESFKEQDVKFTITDAPRKGNFADNLIQFAQDKEADLIMMMTDSRIDDPDFNNSAWSQKLIFNEDNIAVLCINPVYLGQIHFWF